MTDPLLARAIVCWVGVERKRRKNHLAVLAGQGYHVAWADSLAALNALAGRLPLDLVVLDMGGLAADPWRLLRRLRRVPATRELPVVFLSGLPAGDLEAGRALEDGADCLAEPVVPEVLAARVDAAIATFRQFSRPRTWSRGALRSKDGRLILNLAAASCCVQEGLDYEERTLTRKEFGVLALLLRRAPRTVCWRDFFARGWRPARLKEGSRTLVQHVMRLRGKLGALGCRIETVPGAGYRWNG